MGITCAGSYATKDRKYKQVGAEFEHALTVLVTVISRPSAELAVIDAGLTGMTSEFGMPAVRVEGATLTGLSEEHGKMTVSGAARELKAGDKIEILPSHGCATINLYENFHVMEDDCLLEGCVEDYWQGEVAVSFLSAVGGAAQDVRPA